MFDKQSVVEFIKPYYEGKDIMHDMWHIELVERQVNKILKLVNYEIDYEKLSLAMYFHGFIYRDESRIREWLRQNGYEQNEIDQIVAISWESQRGAVPETLEGKILHDAHVLEGGEAYTVVKTLITGSVRGQTLKETLEFMKNHVLGANQCYLPETMPLCDKMNQFTNDFFARLQAGIE